MWAFPFGAGLALFGAGPDRLRARATSGGARSSCSAAWRSRSRSSRSATAGSRSTGRAASRGRRRSSRPCSASRSRCWRSRARCSAGRGGSSSGGCRLHRVRAGGAARLRAAAAARRAAGSDRAAGGAAGRARVGARCSCCGWRCGAGSGRSRRRWSSSRCGSAASRSRPRRLESDLLAELRGYLRAGAAGVRLVLFWLAAAAISGFTLRRYHRPARRGHPDAGRDPDGGRPVAVARLRLVLRPRPAAGRDGAGQALRPVAAVVAPAARRRRRDCRGARLRARPRPAAARWACAAWAAAAVTAAQPTSANPTAPALAFALASRARRDARPSGLGGLRRRLRGVLAPRHGRDRGAGRRSDAARRGANEDRGGRASNDPARRAARRRPAPRRRRRQRPRRAGPPAALQCLLVAAVGLVVLYAPFLIAAGPRTGLGRARGPGDPGRGVVAAAVAGFGGGDAKDFLTWLRRTRRSSCSSSRRGTRHGRAVRARRPERRSTSPRGRTSSTRRGCWWSPRPRRRVRPKLVGAAVLALLIVVGTANRASALLRPPDLSRSSTCAIPPRGGGRTADALIAASSGSSRPGSRSTSRRRRSDLVTFSNPLLYYLDGPPERPAPRLPPAGQARGAAQDRRRAASARGRRR